MANAALFEHTGDAQLTIASGQTRIYVGAQLYMTSAQLAALVGLSAGNQLALLGDVSAFEGPQIVDDGSLIAANDFTLPAGSFTPDTWHTLEMLWDTSLGSVQIALDGVAGADHYGPFVGENLIELDLGLVFSTTEVGQGIYVGKVWVGTTGSSHDLLLEDWSTANFSNWTSTSGDASIVSPPSDPPAFSPSLLDAGEGPPGRVLIAWDDGPLEANPTWTVLDQGGDFPEAFVSGYDIHVGRQTLISQTDTGTATVYINDRAGLLDDRNVSSPYQGKLSGRQIQLQLYNPVMATWEPQFRGLIDDYTYDIDGSAVDANGDPINASVQIECVDVFDYLNGYGLTPGLDGVTPPAGAEDSVYYAATSGTVDDRIIEILTDVGVDPTRYIVASGNVKVLASKYDPDESALTALRDAADAELPFIANCYVNRSGQFVFRGRYSRFAPDAVAAEPGSEWDFTRWKVGDGAAIQSDPTRAQMRVLSYSRDRNELINAAICWPQGLAAADIPTQVFANTSSITAYGKHAAAPLSDLITGDYAGPGTITPTTGAKQCALYAELLVKNKKDPRVNLTALRVESINTSDFRASATWDVLTRSDISHIVNVAAGYPGGTGFTGGATADDYYIEGRQLTVRPANTGYDYVELDLEVSPYIWSADTNSVFPAFGS